MMANPQTIRLQRTLDQIFLQHYDWLLSWSLRFSSNDRAKAEDLLHDLYVRFVQVVPNASSIENEQAYLYTMLRNLHVSNLKLKGVHFVAALSVVEYESLLIGLKAMDAVLFVSLRSELRQICEYACQRRTTLKGASILILRFFLDFAPSEIARLALVPRRSIDEGLRIARSEARLMLGGSRSAVSDRSRAARQPERMAFSGNSADIIQELQGMIFQTPVGLCFAKDQWRDIYEKGSALTAEILAHLASCRVCLALTCQILQLPLPEDFGQNGDAPQSGLPSDSPVKAIEWPKQRNPLLRRASSSLLRIREHRPSQLCIAVNGRVKATHKIASSTSEMDVVCALERHIQFVEIFSEQGVCLLYAQLEDPVQSASPEQVFQVLLSDSRCLRLTYAVGSNEQRLHCTYVDQLLGADLILTRFQPPTSISRSPLRLHPITKAHAIFARRLDFLSWHWVLSSAFTATAILFTAFHLSQRHRPIAHIELSPDSVLAFATEARQHIPAGRYLHTEYLIQQVHAHGTTTNLGSLDSWTDSAGSQTDRRWLAVDRAVLGETVQNTQETTSPLIPDHTHPSPLTVFARDLWIGKLDRSFPDQILANEHTKPHVAENTSGYIVNLQRQGAVRQNEVSAAEITISKAGHRLAAVQIQVASGSGVSTYRLIQTVYEIVPPASLPKAPASHARPKRLWSPTKSEGSTEAQPINPAEVENECALPAQSKRIRPARSGASATQPGQHRDPDSAQRHSGPSCRSA